MHPLTKYLLLQIPGWVIAAAVLLAAWEWAGLGFDLAAGLFALWLVKDLALYPLLRSAYEPAPAIGGERLVGERGVARADLDPRGYILVRGELWRSEAAPAGARIASGAAVRVVAARGMTLIVESDEVR